MWRKRVLIVAAALAGAAGSSGIAEPPITVPAGGRQLFLDDHCVAATENLTRTMHSPTKRGAVIRPDRPWETALQTRCAPAWEEKRRRFQLWLLTSTPAPGVAGTTYAESKDGIHWVKPVLRQWEYLGSRENNFVALDPRSEWPANAMENVVRDPDEPDPSRRYKGFLGAIRRQPIVSPDGIHWRRLEVPSIPSNDESNLTYDRPTRTFIATLKRPGPHGRSHGIWTSRDFANWTDSGVLFSADEQDQTLCRRNVRDRLADPTLQAVQSEPAAYNADIYNLGVFRYEGLYVGVPSVFHASARDDGFHLIQLACSRDLKDWQRLGGRKPFIGPSPLGEGAYDLTQLLPPSGPVVRGDELWFYYTGIKYRQPGPDPKTGAVCLAVLRSDGFLSLDAGDTPGTLTTRSFTAPSGKLSVNVDAAGGSLEVSVLDASNRVVAASKPLTGDGPRAVVRWKSGHPEHPRGQPIRLRFTLRNARLYSFWYGTADAPLGRSPDSSRAGVPADRSPGVHRDGAPPTALGRRERGRSRTEGPKEQYSAGHGNSTPGSRPTGRAGRAPHLRNGAVRSHLSPATRQYSTDAATEPGGSMVHAHLCGGLTGLGALMAVLLASAAFAAAAVPIGSRLELFVDDHLIERMTGGAQRRLHHPQPREIMLVTDQPWEGNGVNYVTVFRDADRYRMYYRGANEVYTKDSYTATHREVVCLAESPDGVHWKRPNLGLVEFNGSRENNIVWDGLGAHNFTPFVDPNPAVLPAAKYKALGSGDGPGGRGLYAFQSADGIHWALMSEKPVITKGAFDSQNLAFSNPGTICPGIVQTVAWFDVLFAGLGADSGISVCLIPQCPDGVT